MSGIDETIVREYFELNGFLVRQLRKYQVQSRAKRTEEEIDLIVYNPSWKPAAHKPDFILFASQLPLIRRAVVFVKPWHSQRFNPSTLRGSADISKFLENDVLKKAEQLFNVSNASLESQEDATLPEPPPLTRILVLPGLPAHEPHKTESIQLLQNAGLDAIISFRSILQDLIGKIEINHNYSKSDFLQILRLLKNYDMVKSPQMELFKAPK